MVSENWLTPSLVLTEVAGSTVREVLAAAAGVMSAVADVAPALIERVLLAATDHGGYAIGKGVAVPHAELEGIEQPLVAVVLTQHPIPVQTMDGRPADIFFVVLSRPDDPKRHLLLLAHLARLAQSRVLCDSLRQARSAAEVVELIQAAELRHASGVIPTPRAQAPAHHLAIVSIVGEQAVDALLVYLLDQGFGSASIFEAQSLREAATREVPLFTGFREIFGDPGGRRMLLLEVETGRIDELTAAMRRICEEYKPGDARISFMPIQTAWAWQPPRPPPSSAGGH